MRHSIIEKYKIQQIEYSCQEASEFEKQFAIASKFDLVFTNEIKNNQTKKR